MYSGERDTVLTVGDQEITFFDNADSAPTANCAYQYGAHSVAAIHHALHSAGFSGKELHAVVTLPISEYYGTDHRKNEVNIAKKKANVMTPVAHEQKKPITISEVVVYPEGLPASVSAITSPLRNLNVGDEDHSFLFDFGGTTLDLCLFSGKAQRIERAKSIELGMFDAFEEVQNTQTKKLSPLAIRKALETGTAMGGRVEVIREEVTRPLMRKAATEIVQFIGDEFISHHFGIGGGAELLANQLKDHGIDVTTFEDSVEVLAVSIAEIEKPKREW